MYLDWYIRVPRVKFDFRSSGVGNFKHDVTLGEVDLSANYAHGNPQTANLLAQRYDTMPENVFISSDGASGQNARVIRCLAERDPRRNEAVVEYPTYEPLLRLAQEYFPHVKRLKRNEAETYSLDADRLRRIVSDKTGLVVLTNPHAPSGAISDVKELKKVMDVANQYGFYVLCDEIYAEFERAAVLALFSVDSELGIVTTSFSKAYGLGGLKLGVALAKRTLVDKFYSDALDTVGTSSNVVEMLAAKLLTEGSDALEMHKQRWARLKAEAQKLLDEKGFEYFPNSVGVTLWLKLPVKDAYKWVNETTIPRHSLSLVPGAFFFFKNDYELVESRMVRLGLGSINPDKPNLEEAFEVLEKALNP
jgi:aspartate/methionine/tyrosine aminotransferase